MYRTKRALILVAVGSWVSFPLVCGVAASAQEPMPRPIQQAPTPSVVHLTLEEATQRAISVNKLLALGAMNVTSKGYATRAVQSNYFPHVIGASAYFHFDEPLGEVLSTRGRPVLGL